VPDARRHQPALDESSGASRMELRDGRIGNHRAYWVSVGMLTSGEHSR
jgi:hypothetical protein